MLSDGAEADARLTLGSAAIELGLEKHLHRTPAKSKRRHGQLVEAGQGPRPVHRPQEVQHLTPHSGEWGEANPSKSSPSPAERAVARFRSTPSVEVFVGMDSDRGVPPAVGALAAPNAVAMEFDGLRGCHGSAPRRRSDGFRG